MKAFFLTVLAMLQFVLGVTGLTPLKPEKINYGGTPYQPPVITEWLTLVENNQSDYVIVIPAQASLPETTAAELLQTSIQKISNVTLPITRDNAAAVAHEICLGETNREGTALASERAGLINEGFVKKVDSGRLFIAGLGSRGTLYGVSSFLEEQLGCRWFMPTLKVFPKSDDIAIDLHLNDTQNPYFEYRYHDWNVSSRDEEWKMLNKINVAVSEKYGGSMVYAHSCHTMDALVPTSYFAEHPEYFSYRIDQGTNTTEQRCLTNPDVLRITIENARKVIIDTQGKNTISITQNDNQGYCQCANCQAMDAKYGGPSGTNIWFTNQVAAALGQEYPDILFDTFAYQYTRSAPTGIVPADNVIVRLCSIECCFTHPINECGHERHEGAAAYVSENKDSSFAKDLADWSKICDNLYIWDYTANFLFSILPFPNFQVLSANMQFFVDSKIKGVFEEGILNQGRSAEFGELRAYVLAKLLWDPYCDVEYHMMDFIKAYYGEASAPFIKEYIDFMARKTMATAHLYIFNWPEENTLLTPIDISKLDALWNKAEKNAGSQEQLDNVRRSRLQLRFYKANMFYGEYFFLNPLRIQAQKQLFNDTVALDVRHFSAFNPMYIPTGFVWWMRPIAWTDKKNYPDDNPEIYEF